MINKHGGDDAPNFTKTKTQTSKYNASTDTRCSVLRNKLSKMHVARLFICILCYTVKK